MQNNATRTGSNWTGQSPRTVREAFPQYPGFEYEEPTLADKVGDVLAIILCIAAFGAVAYFGAALFGG